MVFLDMQLELQLRLVQVLNGEVRANTAPIRMDGFPGTDWRYSGGGYTVMQQQVVDTAKEPFPQFLQVRHRATAVLRKATVAVGSWSMGKFRARTEHGPPATFLMPFDAGLTLRLEEAAQPG
jgi:hypothetical protein